jgi:Co/Zn/Cd efflux system component
MMGCNEPQSCQNESTLLQTLYADSRRSPLAHDHAFTRGNPAAERSTRAVMWITATMMVVEIVAGWWFNSMALLADGWHMGSHAFAIGLSALLMRRRGVRTTRFAFGPGRRDTGRLCQRHLPARRWP